jgi:hypothetical protein
MALAGTEFIYSDTVIDPADTRLAALQAVSRCTPDELPTVLSMLGLDIAPTAVIPDTTERCRNNHPRTPANTRIRPDGFKACRVCSRERDARRRAA